jgi:hypothetical protein
MNVVRAAAAAADAHRHPLARCVSQDGSTLVITDSETAGILACEVPKS